MAKQPKLRWPAVKVDLWPLDQIKPYAKNPRTHPQAQIELLAKLMQKYGVDQPIVVDEHGEILKGHGRRLAALAAGFTEFPVIVSRGLSDEDKIALRIADNQVTLLAEWDETLLKSEFAELQAQSFDLPLLGFDENDFIKFLGGEVEKPDRPLTLDEQKTMNAAWCRAVADWAKILDGYQSGQFLSGQYTKGSLAVYFMRARLFGDDIPRPATLPYTGHRLFVNGDSNGSINEFIHKPFDPQPEATPSIESIEWFCGAKASLDKFLGGTLSFGGFRQPADFPVILARQLYDEFVTQPGGRVLDPCHGWGGRPLGFLLSENAAYYRGFEVDPDTQEGVRAMIDDLLPFAASEKAAELTLCPYEDAQLDDASFDFALTSPPYFDTEKYNGEDSSWRRYQEFEAWVKGFYQPLIEKTAKALKPGAVFALQIGNQRYPLEDTAKQLVQFCGLEFAEKRLTDMVNNSVGTIPEEGEIILILRKPGRKTKGKRRVVEKYGEVL
jgi:ParB/Sulfiredoxin domain/DNA methylase